jgi:starch phosphorylase
MGFFDYLPLEQVKGLTGMFGHTLNYTIAALKLSKIANGVSKIHGKVSKQMWGADGGTCEIISITNAQNEDYWRDAHLKAHHNSGDRQSFLQRKDELKKQLFEVVADQTGKLFDPKVLTIVWARRFAGYKRADLLLKDYDRFLRLINGTTEPVQIIWAGKPYPEDYDGVNLFNGLIKLTASLKNCAVLTGYELSLSAMLKKGSDIWLNTPRYPREASGTSGMTAAMNGSINFSVADGWVPEFAKHGVNSFVIPANDSEAYFARQDDEDLSQLYKILETEVLPTFYHNHARWMEVVKNSINDVMPYFDSHRMVNEYYDKMY